jgi:hypothetical protein
MKRTGVLRAMQRMVLAMLWALLLAIQVLVLVMQLRLYRKQILPSRQEWFTFLGTHFKAPMISLNSRLYSLPESLAG